MMAVVRVAVFGQKGGVKDLCDFITALLLLFLYYQHYNLHNTTNPSYSFNQQDLALPLAPAFNFPQFHPSPSLLSSSSYSIWVFGFSIFNYFFIHLEFRILIAS